MTPLTHFRLDIDRTGVATVLIDRHGERMNTISPELMANIEVLVDRLETDPAVRAVVLGSAKPDNFLAGADIRWLRTLDDVAATSAGFEQGAALFQRIEDLWAQRGKPVVAAIHGPCLGGGLEIALTASMRVCSDDSRTQFGQPEVKLGLIPGGGGTQRLPRLVGIATGLDLILSGRTIRPRRALKIGLVDEVCAEDALLGVARRRAIEAIGRPAPRPQRRGVGKLKSRFSPAGLSKLALEGNPLGRSLLFKKAEQRMLAETKGNYPAPPAALRAVRTGIEQGLDAGYKAEIAEFAKLPASPEAQALISIFLASQDLKKDSGTDGSAEPRLVERVGIIGGGLMGGGIAAVNTTRAHVPSRLQDIDGAGVERGLTYVRRVVDRQVEQKRLTQSDGDDAMALVRGTTDWTGFEDVDIVIEAVFEDLELKRSMVGTIETIAAADTIFGSNTSSLPITDIARDATHPEHVVGMHYFSPVERMPLLEIIVTKATADWVTATCVELGKRQGKTVIVVNDGTGFYTTRILTPYANEVAYLLSAGASIGAIDEAMVQWGFPVGPVTLSDEVGIDTGAKIGAIMQEAYGDRLAAPAIFSRLIEDGRGGRKNGRGFYRYENGKRKGVDETVYEVLGLTGTTSMPVPEIQERLGLHIVNEAARCLDEGILRSARDGDIGAVFGLGFPPFRGGPFMWVDTVGASNIVERLERLADLHGPRYEPSVILREHAATGASFRN